MTIEAALVLAIVLAMLLGLALTRLAADVILMAALTLLLAVPVPSGGGWQIGVISPIEAFAGFANPGVITIGILFVVVRGMRETGGIDFIAQHLLGRPTQLRSALAHVVGPVWAMSIFLNNTPVVAMMIPAVSDWARKLRIPASKLMIPLSYAAILGGTCSLIGTSTNLVVAGLVLSQTDLPGLGMFTITWVGLPAALVGLVFLLFAGPKLLPQRQSAIQTLSDPREYTLEMLVPAQSNLSGKTIEQAGLRNLPGCFLIEIDRDGETIPAVGPDQVLHVGDRLVFAGVVDAVKDLQNQRGLQPATDQVFKLNAPRHRRQLYEAVVGPNAPMAGKTIKQARIRSTYGGAVLAMTRHGKRVEGKLGDIELRPGDVLLLEADAGFAQRFGDARDFLLIKPLEDSAPRRHDRAWVAVGVMAVMVFVAAIGWVSLLTAALVAAGAMLITRCCTASEARASVDWSVLIVIGAALGVGQALQSSGAAQLAAEQLLSLVGDHPWLVLLGIYLLTSLATELITNNAAVALTFPIAQVTAAQMDINFMPFVIAIMIAGSASFATPLGYQTNLMVYGPGGYSLRDFLRIGVPMNLLMMAITVLITPWVFPF